jgi:hypothetical protein
MFTHKITDLNINAIENYVGYKTIVEAGSHVIRFHFGAWILSWFQVEGTTSTHGSV